ncbi:MAG: FG-GAP repeat protein [Bacteroidetes bacterium]|nr:FG-GAP repeat protein [Bacteroidota bacterium]MDA0973304.1 FG-GAP repeat protein [Bacteroidota bacterium]
MQKVLPPNDASSPIGGQSDRLGWSVAVDGEILIAGAPESDVNGSGSGSAFILRKM